MKLKSEENSDIQCQIESLSGIRFYLSNERNMQTMQEKERVGSLKTKIMS